MWLPSVLKRVTYYFGSGRGGGGRGGAKGGDVCRICIFDVVKCLHGLNVGLPWVGFSKF